MGKYRIKPIERKTKSGYLVCVVPMCQTKKSTTTLKTFEFPSDLKRRTEWISAIVDATIKNEDSSLEDLYSMENRRMELEMEISAILGDHSYVCARHFQPEDIIVHPNVCRLAANAVPSVFQNYPIELPRQFFKKICQTVQNSDCGIIELVSVPEQPDTSNTQNEYIQEITDCDPLKTEIIDVTFDYAETYDVKDAENGELDQISFRPCYIVSRGTNTKLKYTGVSNTQLSANKLRKQLRLLQTRYKNLQNRFIEMENKFKQYNIDSLEKDAGNNNEEARFLLEMLQTYKVFEKTREEILSSHKSS